AAFQQAAQTLAAAGEWHRLFDLRLLQARYELGLDVGRRDAIDDVEEPVRTRLEAAYLHACREVGELLLDAGRYREAWMYLRPAGDKQLVRERLSRAAPDLGDDDALDELIEIALFEAVDPERGYAWLLQRQGTCNGITTLDSLQSQLSPGDLRACAAILVRHVYGELRGNLRGHLARLKGEAPATLSLGELMRDFPELTEQGSYHLDPSHLVSALRYARLVQEPRLWSMADEMVEYGRRLPDDLQYPDVAPFEKTYVANSLYFGALLGRNVEEAIDFFASRTRRIGAGGEGPDSGRDDLEAAAAYVDLLSRLGRPGAALQAYAELTPVDRELGPLTPSLLDLARASGDWDAYADACRRRNDLVALIAGAVSRQG
ncbi:MAG: hypothetical protein KDA61_11895, partial [Planctomycetales bacterium]|nr:hypothetical protein [Planctomycetales bacterium]